MTIAPRLRKVLRDISDNPIRSTLAVLAMAAGAFGVGAILSSYSILARELATSYVRTRPAAAILMTDSVSDAVVDAVRRAPGVRDAEARPVIRGRILVGKDEWVPLTLFVVRDFNHLRLDRFVHDLGKWPPAADEVLLERTGLSVARSFVGGRITASTANGNPRALRIAGTVHAPGLAPAWMEHAVTGFVGWESIMRVDRAAESGQLRIAVSEHGLDAKHIAAIANDVKALLATRTIGVTRVEVPPPGRHPHADQMDTFLFLLGAFAALTLALSAVLVANMIHGLLAEQVRQIGVMKAIGASTGQIAGLYLSHVSIIAALALCLGMPLGTSAGMAYAQFSATILNVTLMNTSVPFWALAIQGLVGILVPLAVSIVPVHRASRITIHEAFSNDVGRRPFGTRRFDRWLAGIRGLPRPLMLSLRTTFHRRGRLVLTVGTLALGGAVFIAALDVSAAWTRNIAADARAHRYDIEVRLTEATPIARVADALATVPDVVHTETWAEVGAELVRTNDSGDARVILEGLAPGSKLLALPLVDGRWLRDDDAHAVVINQVVQALDPSLRAGGTLVLRARGKTVAWRIVGVVKEVAPVPFAYARARPVLELMREPEGTVRSLRIVTRRHDAAGQLAASQAIERAFRRSGIVIQNSQRLEDRRKAFEDHLVIIESALLFAAALVVMVGGLGLTSTLTLNVVERTREIGILSAIGATPRMISSHVVAEAVVMALLSWCMALVVAVPVTLALDTVAGRIFHKSALEFTMSPGAVGMWLVLVVFLASLSSFYPARRALKLAVREALTYE
jgi:putative ABC transport system permease protein